MSKHFTLRNKTGTFSIQIHKQSFLLLILLAILTLGVFMVSLSAGSNYIPLSSVIKELFMESEHSFVLNELRMPRVVMGAVVGAALGVSGLILQLIIRNPLGAPDIVGVTGGASVGTVLFMVYFLGEVSIHWQPLSSIIARRSSLHLFIFSHGIMVSHRCD